MSSTTENNEQHPVKIAFQQLPVLPDKMPLVETYMSDFWSLHWENNSDIEWCYTDQHAFTGEDPISYDDGEWKEAQIAFEKAAHMLVKLHNHLLSMPNAAQHLLPEVLPGGTHAINNLIMRMN